MHLVSIVRAGLLLGLAASVTGLATAQEMPAPAVLPESLERDDPCRGEARSDAARLDRLRQGVFTGVCSTSRWFDGLFGDARDFTEAYQRTYGRVGVGVTWDELDHFELDGHFRASIDLPALGNRFNAVVGRETEDSYIRDSFDEIGFLPGSFSDEGGAAWYAGLNYGAVRGTNSRFDIGTGVQVKSPLNPYVKARYRHYFYPGDGFLIGTRTTAFWENEDGFGVTLAADADWSFGDSAMLRWANTATRSEATDGIRWKSRLIWYQAMSEKSAMRYEVGSRGQTDGVQPDLSGVKVTYRRSIFREWFFVETFGAVFWADNVEPGKRCEACGAVGLGFEMMFGDRYDKPAVVGNQRAAQ